MEMTNDAFLQLVKGGKRYIPVAIDIADAKITWLDFEGYHFYEGFFHRSREVFAALKRGELNYAITDIDILLDDAVSNGCLYPSGFIFHAGRSGSTLLSKVLSRSVKNHVISEAGPLNAIWHYFAKLEIADDERKRLYKNLVLVLGRPNGSAHQHYVVKYTSYNILSFAFIHTVFPDVPAIFLTREVDDILKSFDKNQPPWLKPDNALPINPNGTQANTDARMMVESFFAEARKYPQDVLMPIDYKNLSADILPAILERFHINADAGQLRLMQKQFAFDSKVEFNQKKFNSF
jgi:hypothetical protein